MATRIDARLPTLGSTGGCPEPRVLLVAGGVTGATTDTHPTAERRERVRERARELSRQLASDPAATVTDMANADAVEWLLAESDRLLAALTVIAAAADEDDEDLRRLVRRQIDLAGVPVRQPGR